MPEDNKGWHHPKERRNSKLWKEELLKNGGGGKSWFENSLDVWAEGQEVCDDWVVGEGEIEEERVGQGYFQETAKQKE